MAASFDDLTQPLTVDEASESIYTVLAQVGISTTNWKPGAVVRTIIAIFAVVLAAFSAFSAQVARGGFLTLATGSWLKLVAKYVYGVTAIDATFATGELTVTNNGGGVYSFAAGDLIVSNTTTGKSFRNMSAFSLGAMEGPITVNIIAVEAGADSTSDAATITTITAPALSNVVVTNAARIAGRDAETDAELTTRAQESLGAMSPNGPWDAYSFTVKSAIRTDGSSLGITRVRIIKDGYGNVRIVCAAAESGIDSDDITTAESAVINNAEPQCVNATVESASVVIVEPTYTAWIYNTAGLTEQQVKDTIEAALAAFFKLQPIGGNIIPPATIGYLFADSMQAAVKSAIPQCVRATVTNSDLALAITDVPVLGAITPTIHFVTTPEGQTV